MVSHGNIFFFLSWYLKAQQIAPKNGRPYNQLALLAVYTVSDMELMLLELDFYFFAGIITSLELSSLFLWLIVFLLACPKDDWKLQIYFLFASAQCVSFVGCLPSLTLFPPLSFTETEVRCCLLLHAQLGRFQPHPDCKGKPDESVWGSKAKGETHISIINLCQMIFLFVFLGSKTSEGHLSSIISSQLWLWYTHRKKL